jgi:hypothetical protein
MRTTCSSHLFTVLVCAVLGACGANPNANSVGEIGWAFDYRDWTNNNLNAAPSEPRDCANQPAANPGPAYDAIKKVRLLLEDPDGQIPGADVTFNCGEGYQGRVSIVGVTRAVYAMRLEALTATNEVVYLHEDPAFDLSAGVDELFTLKAAVGELDFNPTFAGSLSCAAGVQTLRYKLFQNGPNGPSTTPTLEGSVPACDSGLVTRLYIHDVPVAPTPGANDNWQQTTYRVLIEALDAGGSVLHCRDNPSRTVRPGKWVNTTSESLSPGSCL